jgi:hypothetical protein
MSLEQYFSAKTCMTRRFYPAVPATGAVFRLAVMTG